MGITWGLHPDDRDSWIEMWDSLGGIGGLSHREAQIVADVGRRDMASHFEHERSPDGEPWQPLAPFTQEQRGYGIDSRGVQFRTGRRHPIQVRTGDLKRSFTDPTHPRNVTEIFAPSGQTFISLGAEDDPQTPGRIATLNFGGTVYGSLGPDDPPREREVPARPWIGLSDSGEAQVDAQTRALLTQRLERI